MDKNILLCVILLFSTVILKVLGNYLLISDKLYFDSLSARFTYEQIVSMLQKKDTYPLFSFLLLVLLTFLKISLTTLSIAIGTFFVSEKIQLKALFTITLKSQFLFLIPTFLKILWFVFIQTDYTLQDLQFFYPLSALNFFDYNTLEPWLVYPLQLLNVFEIVYWFVLARGIQEAPKPPMGASVQSMSFERSFLLVLSSYGVGLLLWVAVVMFISVSYSP
jgi:hypothetical protein